MKARLVYSLLPTPYSLAPSPSEPMPLPSIYAAHRVTPAKTFDDLKVGDR